MAANCLGATPKQGAAFCIHDLHLHLSPLELTSDLAYVRLHGPLIQPYTGGYGARALARWAERLLSWKREAYVFFDNTVEGDAITDALYLQTLIRAKGWRAAVMG